MVIFRQPERGSQNRRANAAPANRFGGKTQRLGGEQGVLQGSTNADLISALNGGATATFKKVSKSVP